MVVLVAAPWKLPVDEGLDEAGREVNQRQGKEGARGCDSDQLPAQMARVNEPMIEPVGVEDEVRLLAVFLSCCFDVTATPQNRCNRQFAARQ